MGRYKDPVLDLIGRYSDKLTKEIYSPLINELEKIEKETVKKISKGRKALDARSDVQLLQRVKDAQIGLRNHINHTSNGLSRRGVGLKALKLK